MQRVRLTFRCLGALGAPVALLSVIAGCGGGQSGGPMLPAQIVLPYVVQAILYQPPFNQSSVSYAERSTLGTHARWSASDSLGAALAVRITGTPPRDATYVVTVAADGAIVTDISDLASVLDNPALCDSGDVASCEPDGADPDHAADVYRILFGVVGLLDRSDGQVSYTFDLSTGTSQPFTAAQLDRLAQDPSDDSVFCVDAVCNDTQKELAHRYFKTPTDVRQLLALDPFILGISTDQHPERFAPACTSAGSCAAPLRLTVDNQPVTGGPAVIVSADHAQANPADPSQTGDTGVEQNVVLSSGLDGPGIGTLSISYRDVTASPDFADRSASIVLRNSSHCERGDVDIWFDKAFGAFLWNARMTNACRP